jgi:beta-1,4-mannosyltransferase
MAALTFVSFFALGVLAVCTWRLLHRPKARARSVAVLVLGDIARSPRMMYHALSFERHHFTTAIVGYYDSRLPTQMLETNIQPVFLQRFPASLSKLPFLLLAPLKVLWQFASLFYVLAFNLPFTPEFIVLQVCCLRITSI